MYVTVFLLFLEVFLYFDFCALQQVSHGAIQFTAYEELRKTIVDFKSKGSDKQHQNPDQLLVS